MRDRLKELTLALFLASSACGSLPKTAPGTDVSPLAAEHRTCTADTDCVIACRQTLTCCGELCECAYAINTAWHQEIRAWDRANCQNAGCPVADCDVPRFNHTPRCVDGQCVDEKTPWKSPNP